MIHSHIKLLSIIDINMCNINILVATVLALSLNGVFSANIRNRRWLVDDNGCRTPDQGVGNCVPITQCPALKSLTSSRRNLPELRKYYCSLNGGVVSVCCPSKPVEAVRYNDNHRNINLLPADCGTSIANHKITNGEKADLFEFPWQVALKYNDRRSPFACAGSLINNKYVLTAAHCIKGLPLTGVRLGEYNFQTNPDCEKERNITTCAQEHIEIAISSSDVTVHENYNPNRWRNDIALIRLPRKVDFSNSISPVCLPIKQSFVKDLGNLTVIGWGRTEKFEPSPVLLKVTVPLMNSNLCRGAFRGRIDVTDNQFCAGGKDGKDSCRGDSGGPIMHSVIDDFEIKWVQTGIVSFGIKFCGTEKIPAIYTKLTAYTDWILNNLKP